MANEVPKAHSIYTTETNHKALPQTGITKVYRVQSIHIRTRDHKIHQARMSKFYQVFILYRHMSS